MPEATLSQKYQIVIPKEARKEMGIEAGDKIIVETIHGVTLLIPKPKKTGTLLKGLLKGLYPKDYLSNERKSWLR